MEDVILVVDPADRLSGVDRDRRGLKLGEIHMVYDFLGLVAHKYDVHSMVTWTSDGAAHPGSFPGGLSSSIRSTVTTR